MDREGFLFVGDIHWEESAMEELGPILTELVKIPAKYFIQLGDLCDKNKLASEELTGLTYFMTLIAKAFKNTLIIRGNHDTKDKNVSIIDYLLNLGIGIYDNEKVIQLTPEGHTAVLGHFFLDKSRDSFGHYRYTLEEYLAKGFTYSFLGHQHNFQKLHDKVYHLGSVRYVSFGEDETIKKQVAWLHQDGRLEFIEIPRVIPIRNVSSINDLSSINKRTKVRYLFNSFEQLKNEIKTINELKGNFYEFKTKINFKPQPLSVETKQEKPNSKEFVNKWLGTIQDSEVKNILNEEFKLELL